jgi:hypothetical protein
VAAATVDTSETPAGLRDATVALNRFVNASAGRLPVGSVVQARRITDLLREIVDTSAVRPLDVYAVLSVKRTLTDYLPTTLHAYLALDPEVVAAPGPSGMTPAQSLNEQLDALESSAAVVLAAARKQDVDALVIQGRFLSTKFTGSDLDL